MANQKFLGDIEQGNMDGDIWIKDKELATEVLEKGDLKILNILRNIFSF